jgi:hypothetical protein
MDVAAPLSNAPRHIYHCFQFADHAGSGDERSHHASDRPATGRRAAHKPFASKYSGTDMAVVPHRLCKSGFPLCLPHGADDGQHQSARRLVSKGLRAGHRQDPQVDLLGFQPGDHCQPIVPPLGAGTLTDIPPSQTNREVAATAPLPAPAEPAKAPLVLVPVL